MSSIFNDMFLDAVKKGQHEEVRRLSGCERYDINYFKYAVKTNIETVKALLDNKNIEKISSDILFYVLDSKDFTRQQYNMMKFLLEDVKLDPNICDYQDNHILFCVKDIQLIKLLVENGSDINAKDKRGRSLLLLYAKFTKKSNMILLLLSHENIDIYVYDEDNNNIMHHIIKNYSSEMDSIITLVDKNLMNDKNTLGHTPIVYIINKTIDSSIYETLVYIINNKLCDLNITNDDGNNILYIFRDVTLQYIYDERSKDLIKKLIDHGINPYHVNKENIRMIDLMTDPVHYFIDKYMEQDIKEPVCS